MRIINTFLIIFLLATSAFADFTRPRTEPILGGQFADLQTTPVAFITGFSSDGSSYSCTGTLVGSIYILTAAHCVSDGVQFVVTIAGQDYISSTAYYSSLYSKQGDLEEIVPYDLGMIILSSPVTSIDPVPIIIDDTISVGTEAIVYGYGRNEFSGGRDLSIVDGKQASVLTGAVSRGIISAFYISTSSITCHGDSGGPLVTSIAGSPAVVIGTVSAGTTLTTTDGICTRQDENDTTFYTDLTSTIAQQFLSNFAGVKTLSGRLYKLVYYLDGSTSTFNSAMKSKNIKKLQKNAKILLAYMNSISSLSNDSVRLSVMLRILSNLTKASKAKTVKQGLRALKTAKADRDILIAMSYGDK